MTQCTALLCEISINYFDFDFDFDYYLDLDFYDKNQNQYNDKNQNLNDNKNQNQNNVLKSHITKLYIVSRGETGHLSGGGDIRGTYVTSFK